MSKIIDELNNELAKAGVPTNYTGKSKEPMTPLSALVNGPFSVKPYVKILLKYGPCLEPRDKTYVARALSEKGVREAVPFLLSIFKDHPDPNRNDLWAVGNALSIIDDKESYPAILELCKDKRYGVARQMLMRTLAKIKTEEAYETLVNCLNDPTVKAHAIEALGLMGNIKAIEVLEGIEVKKGLYEYRAKETALKRLRRKKEKILRNK